MATRRMAAALWLYRRHGSGGGLQHQHQATIPADFCKVPVSKAALSPLMPHKGSVKQTYYAFDGQPGAARTLSVGGHGVLFVDIERRDRPRTRTGSPRQYRTSTSQSGRSIVTATGAPGDHDKEHRQ